MAQAARLHSKWVRATKQGARSPECQELNTIYSQCVDGVSVRIPNKLLSPPEPQEGPPFILDTLLEEARKFADEFFNKDKDAITTGTCRTAEEAEAHIELFLSLHELPISEFRLALLVWNLCASHHLSFERWIGSFNFNAMSYTEKHILVDLCGIDVDRYPFIWNR